jgi:BirA family biotin operon repressor/biotin-[acetyl-CoA-carboxylase] ligase
LSSEQLDEDSILRGLKTRRFGRPLVVVDECGSTNDVVKGMAESGAPNGLVVIAETQTAGRGRLGRAWYSPRGGVWLSILVKAQELPSFLNCLPLVGALGIVKPLVEKWGLKARVRWPNDVVVGWRKIAGVSVESKSKGNELIYAILGIGINANFDTNKIAPISGASASLLTLLGGPVNRENLITVILSETEKMCESLYASGGKDLVVLLRELDCSRGEHVKVRTPEREVVGTVDDYESLSRVRIITRDGFESIETSALVSVDYQSD